MNPYFLGAAIAFIVIVILVYFYDKRRHPDDDEFTKTSTFVGLILGIIFVIYAFIVN